MKRTQNTYRKFGLILIAGISLAYLGKFATHRAVVEEKVPDVLIHTLNGSHVHLSDFVDRRLLVLFFYTVECPISNKYLPRIKELAAEYSKAGVEFIGVDPSNYDSVGEVVEHARSYQIPFRLAKDWDAKIAQKLGIKRTAEVAVISTDLDLIYKGRIDEQFEYTVARAAEGKTYLKDAITSFLKGQTPQLSRTEGLGCAITYPSRDKNDELTYADNISHVVQEHCLMCHVPDGIAPFSLNSYDKIVKWAPMIQEVISDRRMPPWHADRRYGKWSNDRSLSDEEREMLLSWIDAGMAPGKVPKNEDRSVSSDSRWKFGQPDYIASTPMYDVRPNGPTYFENYFHKEKFDKETWVNAIEVISSNPKVVHHVTVYVIPQGTDRPLDWDDWGFFAAAAPGYSVTTYPKGYAKRIPAGASLYVETHYSPIGKKSQNQTSIGFHFTRPSRHSEVHTYGLGLRKFTIPAGASDYVLTAKTKVETDSKIFSLYPHGHFRAVSFTINAAYPNGTSETLLSVPRYDLNWQTSYKYSEPKSLPKGTEITCEAHYDNSFRNPRNPDPKKDVTWGPLSEDEMMYCFLDYAEKDGTILR